MFEVVCTFPSGRGLARALGPAVGFAYSMGSLPTVDQGSGRGGAAGAVDGPVDGGPGDPEEFGEFHDGVLAGG
jgi:hypothetical protein